MTSKPQPASETHAPARFIDPIIAAWANSMRLVNQHFDDGHDIIEAVQRGDTIWARSITNRGGRILGWGWGRTGNPAVDD